MGCKYIYLDADGNPSAVYQRALEKYGKEKAEELYIRHMMPIVNTKFSENIKDNYLDRSTHIEVPVDNEKVYRNITTGAEYDRITDIVAKQTVSESKPKSDMEELLNPSGAKTKTFEEILAISRTAKARKLIGLSLPADQTLDDDAEKSAIDAFLRTKPDVLTDAEKDIDTINTLLQTAGTDIHWVMDKVFKAWEEASVKHEETAGKNAILPVSAVEQIIRTLMEEHGDWPAGINFFSAKNAITPVLELIEKLSRANGGIRYHLKSELKIYSEHYKVPNSTKKGVAGSIDLYLIDENKQSAYLIDFKTKLRVKAKSFDVPTGQEIQGPFNTPIKASAAGRALAQELFYATVLHGPEYGMPIDGVLSIVIPIDIKEVGNEVFGSKEFALAGVGKPLPRNPGTDLSVDIVTVGNKLGSVAMWLTDGDVKATLHEARKTGIAGTVERWSGENEEGMPNATYSKEWKSIAIDKALKSKRTHSTKGLIVRFLKREIPVGNKTDEQLTEVLGMLYDNHMKEQQTIGSDVVDTFNSKEADLRLPKSLQNKHAGLRELLRDIRIEDYELHLAQDYLPELKGIGPDVIIARHKGHKNFILLSAVTTSNNLVTFPTDGSEDTRTSLWGKYVTDKGLAIKGVPTDLLVEPKAHDFHSMKLGIAALYLYRKFPNNFNVRDIRVVSMSSAQKSTSTLEEELVKLEMFAEYAGDEFPNELRAILTEINADNYVGSLDNQLDHLMLQIHNNQDPLGPIRNKDLKEKLYNTYVDYKKGKLVGWELRVMLGKYLQMLGISLSKNTGYQNILNNKKFIMVSQALSELQKFAQDEKNLAADRVMIAAINSAIQSGDQYLMRHQVIYNDDSTRIRKYVEGLFDEHTKLFKALLQEKGATPITNSTSIFEQYLYKDQSIPENRMVIKSLEEAKTDAERNYIKFFNRLTVMGLLDCSPEYNAEDIKNGRFWPEGTVPIMHRRPEIISAKTFSSMDNFRKSMKFMITGSDKKKKDKSKIKEILEFEFDTQFGDQAMDEALGNSDKRRRALGLKDVNVPTDMDPDIETNLAVILNTLILEAAEKVNYELSLQTRIANQSVLASKQDGSKTRLTSDMLEVFNDLIYFQRYKDEPLANITDPINTISSQLMFAYSLRQMGTEFSTGTLQIASTFMANTINNMVMDYLKVPENERRFSALEFAEVITDLVNGSDKFEQIIYDNGMLQADSNDLRDADFYAQNSWQTFKSESGFWMNRIFFSGSISHVFLAQMKHLGVTEAYVLKDGKWVYDETKDPRFFVYDPETNLGTVAPLTEAEKQKHSEWLATRKDMDDSGLLDTNKRMIVPLTGNQRAEIKNYATRIFGSFNKDNTPNGDTFAMFRNMTRYKKWALQRVANYYTPTVKDEPMYGHFETVKNEKTGEYYTSWVGDDFEGVLQTFKFMMNELKAGRRQALLGNLNKYQRENLSKLMADMFIAMLMMAIILPLMGDKTATVNKNTGKVTMVTGEFGKSELGINALAGVKNATFDLFFAASLPSLTQSLTPGLSVAYAAGSKGLTAVYESIFVPGSTPLTTAAGAIKPVGLVRTATSASDFFNLL